MLIGITGSIACGKTTIGNILKNMHFQVIDCDILSHDIIKKGQTGYDEVIHHFGKDILLQNEEIDRHKLGQIVFNDAKEKKILESIIHPKVIEEVLKYHGDDLIFFEVPLLFETGMEKYFDATIVIETSKEIQIERLKKRDGLTKAEAIKRIEAQMTIDEKIALGDYVIHNHFAEDKLILQIEDIIKKLKYKK